MGSINVKSMWYFTDCICPSPQVQSKVNLKYDSWHKEVLSKFGQMLGQNMQDFHAQISKVSHYNLEGHFVCRLVLQSQ